MSNKIWFDPTSDKWVLSDGEHYLEVPYWARGIIADEFERETEPLKTENAKLRELVRDMQHAIACLVVLGDDYAGEHEDELCALDDRMRELGVDA